MRPIAMSAEGPADLSPPGGPVLVVGSTVEVEAERYPLGRRSGEFAAMVAGQKARSPVAATDLGQPLFNGRPRSTAYPRPRRCTTWIGIVAMCPS
ncbi:hypothetical protein ACFYSC_30225 [Streptosporangium sp. NPDC004379]|uniref:hypothetical protein n=1 Tax=Streptosporangium sp. NPDC004379 TaxID=3366189 RepID=UPI00369C8BF9